MAAGFLAGAFFLAAGFTPAALAFSARSRFWRAALFLWMTPFFTALSISLKALLWAAAELLPPATLLNDFKALLSERLVLELRTAALLDTRTRFLADLIIGINLNHYLNIISLNSNYTDKEQICKEIRTT